jgi:mitochondrial fission protein ELM1
MAIRTEQDALLNEVKANTGTALSPSASILIDDTAAHTGPYFAITALADAVIDHANSTTNITDSANFTLPKGVTIYGNFEVLAIDSGSVIAYTK